MIGRRRASRSVSGKKDLAQEDSDVDSPLRIVPTRSKLLDPILRNEDVSPAPNNNIALFSRTWALLYCCDCFITNYNTDHKRDCVKGCVKLYVYTQSPHHKHCTQCLTQTLPHSAWSSPRRLGRAARSACADPSTGSATAPPRTRPPSPPPRPPRPPRTTRTMRTTTMARASPSGGATGSWGVPPTSITGVCDTLSYCRDMPY